MLVAGLLFAFGCEESETKIFDNGLVGDDDDVAQTACDAQGDTPVEITASATEDDAPLLDPSDTPYNIKMDASGISYVGIQTGAEHNDVALFTKPTRRVARLIIGGTDSSFEEKANAACADAGIGDIRFHQHMSGTVTLALNGTEDLWLVYQLGMGHGGKHDGGHHDGGTHDGGHDHE